MKFKSGSHYLPKESKSKPKGEDAHFICDEKCTIGVADGVGGFAKYGIDSGIYARELMSNSVTVIKDWFSGSNKVVNPEKVLSEAYWKTKAKGASTACIITLNKFNVVHAVNVGDSGFLIIRRGKTIYKSPSQQRGFNCPYQLGNSWDADRPSSAEVIKVGVQKGDIIVAGSDGLFDNMFTEEIELTMRQLGNDVEPQEVAMKIAKQALSNSNDAHIDSPFHLASMRSGSSTNHHRGGKIDDITDLEILLHCPKLGGKIQPSILNTNSITTESSSIIKSMESGNEEESSNLRIKSSRRLYQDLETLALQN